MRRIALVGFRGVGKSTLTKELQNYFSTLAVSLDAYIENEEKMTIAEIVAQKGWRYFREKEYESIRNLLDISGDIILDTGGGIVEDGDGQKSEKKIKLLKENFYCVYVYMQDDLLLERLQDLGNDSSRVILRGEIKQTLAKRKPWFEQLADVQVDVSNLPVTEAAKKVFAQIKKSR